MGFKKFSLLIISRTILAIISLVVLTQTIAAPGYHAASFLMTIVLLLQFAEIIRFVAKTNAELVRFFETARYADFSQRFELSQMGAGFDELGVAFNEILDRIQTIRTAQEEELRHLKAVVEHVPVPLISIHHDDQITLWNNSARRLFGTHSVTRLDDLLRFDSQFPKKLLNLAVGQRDLINIEIDGVEHHLSISSTEIITSQQKDVLISMQDIQNELDVAQLSAWQDLVRVLTHEIMNSITPVASLAKTAVDIVGDVKEKTNNIEEIKEDLDDVLGAVKTVARRSEGLMQFVKGYRRLTRLPPPNKKHISIDTLLSQIKILATQGWSEKGIKLKTNITPASLDIYVDVDMIEQVLINLLRNSEQAMAKTSQPQVEISAFINLRGRAVIEIIDNGDGVPEDIASQIFVPFFTTKNEGSGVGLALTRQIMIAHSGSITLRKNQQGGATFSLTF